MRSQSFFYTAEPIFKSVYKEEFDKFVSEYPRKLNRDCCGISEPPLVTYNDFELANKWPYSIVAKYHDGYPCDYYGWNFEPDYQIVVNYKELYYSKTGNRASEIE
jgi:hypothetical protein